MIRRLEENLKSVKCRTGSALVLVIVVTVMLAVVGVMFVMMARVDSIATSTISENSELAAAVDTVVEQINTVLVEDLFWGDGTGPEQHLLAGSTAAGGRPDYSNFDIVNEPWDAPLSTRPFIGLGDDPWLASLEPRRVSDRGTPADPSDDDYRWRHISDIYGNMIGPFVRNLRAIIAEPSDAAHPLIAADADGDGVEDSRWVRLPITSSKGRPIFAAVRIIDHCGMLNLNTAHSISANSEGQYLSSVDYERFLRGNDRLFPDRIRRTRDPLGSVDNEEGYHDVIMNIENPGSGFFLFDIGDELEIRNRYLLTSRVEARFERNNVANYTLDAGGGLYGALEIPRTASNFNEWKRRMDHWNFDGISGGDPCDAYKYDRRHVCTFYSFDRNLRRRTYPLVDVVNDVVDPNRTDWLLENNPVFSPDVGVPVNIRSDISSNNFESRQNILHLLYAFRAYFLDIDSDTTYQEAARRSAQLVANMIDYMDTYSTEGPFYDAEYGDQTNEGLTYDHPTYLNREIIKELILEVSEDAFGVGNGTDIDNPAPGQNPFEFGLGIDDPDETVYGYERQPFISELYCEYDGDAGGVQAFAIELCNPYENPNGFIDLEGWRIDIGGISDDLSGIQVDQASAGQLGRLVIKTSGASVPALGVPEEINGFGMSLVMEDIVELQRPNPAWESGDPPEDEFITVDATEPAQTNSLLTSGNGIHVSKRDDSAWKFTNSSSYTIPDPCDYTSTLGDENGVSPSLPGKGYQMPVLNPLLSENKRFATPHDFEMVLSIGNEKIGDEPNAVTNKVGLATSEGDVRFDIASRPELLEYVCFMNRPNLLYRPKTQWNLPGRININTATMEVIRAAIPPEVQLWDANSLAEDIVNYRNGSQGPFERISDLLEVEGFNKFVNLIDDPNGDDHVGDAQLGDDIEERDWILSRVANIFTVRSDVFTAYILVRIGHSGPQKRMIAIFDRSNVYWPTDRPRLVALHPVPNPR
jgi:hypothetical protein